MPIVTPCVTRTKTMGAQYTWQNAVKRIHETEPRNTLKDNTLSTSEFYFINVNMLLHKEI